MITTAIMIGVVGLNEANALTVEEFDSLAREQKQAVSSKIVNGVFATDFKDAPQSDRDCIRQLFEVMGDGSVPEGVRLVVEQMNEAREVGPEKYTVEGIVFAIMRNQCDTQYRLDKILRQSEAATEVLDNEIERLDQELEELASERDRMLRCTSELPDGRKVFRKSYDDGTFGYVFSDGSRVPRSNWSSIKASTNKLPTDDC